MRVSHALTTTLPYRYVVSHDVPLMPFGMRCVVAGMRRDSENLLLLLIEDDLNFLFFFFSLFFSWSGLFCCVLIPGTLRVALHLLYLDEF